MIRSSPTTGQVPARRRPSARSLLWLGSAWVAALLHPAALAETTNLASRALQVIAIEGTNWWIAPVGAADWVQASTQMPQPVRVGDRIRTGRYTRLLLQTPHLGVVQVPPFTTLEVPSPAGGEKSVWIRIVDGMIYFFHRGSPADVEIHTKTASAAIRGTEFVARARDDGGLQIQLIDGAVELQNALGTVLLHGGDEGTAAAGQTPTRTPLLYAHRAIQWCLYYPAVLDAEELPLAPGERTALAESLQAYRAGDLIQALARFPSGRDLSSAGERIYLAALLLSIGRVDDCETLLGTAAPAAAGGGAEIVDQLADALRRTIASTRGDAPPPRATPRAASQWVAESYALQADGKLVEALAAAREATRLSPGLGLGWVRVAELEFSFGRVRAAEAAVNQALSLSPRHAPAVALHGFVLAARLAIGPAREAFERAIALDPGLGIAWLGRGLTHLRHGEVQAGLDDLEVAAAVEPQRAIFRSYLGKAFEAAGDARRASKELSLSRELDPGDPTGWLYAALLDHTQNRINDGIRELRRSKELNENRQIFRSRQLLDQDQAVRGANLAALYRDAGLVQLSRREALDAVEADYASGSAHLFLAQTYNELRDPRQVDLRYETPWFNEYLLANLLTPSGAGTLSPLVSDQEFSRLLERNRVGFSSRTEYTSRGDWTQSAAQYGRFDHFSYALESDDRWRAGERPNNDLEQHTYSVRWKQDLGLQDSFYLQAIAYDADGGDLSAVYDPTNPASYRARFRYHETQEPLLTLGYHHSWSPGNDTLVLLGRLQDRVRAADPAQPVLLISKDPTNTVTGTLLTGVHEHYTSEVEIYGAEIQQMAQLHPTLSAIAGTRYQFGDFHSYNRQETLADQSAALPAPLEQSVRPTMHHFSGYAYGHWRVTESVLGFAGLSYDWLQYPANDRFAPLLAGEAHAEQWSPKAGVVWKITPASTLRGAYTRSLGGVTLEQSERLEPSQVAGFNQAWRSLIPESVAGSQAGAPFESAAVMWDYRSPRETYAALRGELNHSSSRRAVGVFDLRFLAEPSFTPEHLNYDERNLSLTLSQLLGHEWAVGGEYQLREARLQDRFPAIPDSVPNLFPPYQLQPRQNLESTLHELRLFAVFNHPSGFFARAESLWARQSNRGYAPDRPGDDFWQFHLFGGYRCPGRRAEVQVGLLNLTDQDYRLNPLNLTPELPRRRTFTATLKFNF